MNCPTCNVHIDEHEASRCLDAWVAADIMELPQNWVSGCLNYSTSIAAAWGVVEKLSKHYYVDIGVDDTGAQVQLDCLHVDSLGNTRWELAFVESTRAPAAPLAICRAAIKATA